MDKFQERYLEHQERKRNSLTEEKGVSKREYNLLEKMSLIDIMTNRRSQRIFNDTPIKDIEQIIKAISLAPSSCNRQAIYLKEVDKVDVEKLLVGGTGWMSKADKVFLVFADKVAYKSPYESSFMPYLDAGFVGQNIYLMCEVLGIGCCFVNPNIREENKQEFSKSYNQDQDYFCGAFALGNYDKKSNAPPRRGADEVLKQ